MRVGLFYLSPSFSISAVSEFYVLLVFHNLRKQSLQPRVALWLFVAPLIGMIKRPKRSARENNSPTVFGKKNLHEILLLVSFQRHQSFFPD